MVVSFCFDCMCDVVCLVQSLARSVLPVTVCYLVYSGVLMQCITFLPTQRHSPLVASPEPEADEKMSLLSRRSGPPLSNCTIVFRPLSGLKRMPVVTAGVLPLAKR